MLSIANAIANATVDALRDRVLPVAGTVLVGALVCYLAVSFAVGLFWPLLLWVI